MPIYVYWGEDDFAIKKAVEALRDRTVDPVWTNFNYTVTEDAIAALSQSVTPPFGIGGRLVWLVNNTICQHCPDTVLKELIRTIPAIPESTSLVVTLAGKPDERLKATKLIKKSAQEYREFALIPPWKTDLIIKSVNEVAQALKVKLTSDAIAFIADAIGNDTRRLYSEMEKLKLYADGILGVNQVSVLIRNTNSNTLQLAAAIKSGDTGKALSVLSNLILDSEPGLKISATLISQFRTWALVKCAVESGERDNTAIARLAEISNPKRVYFLQQEVSGSSSQQLSRVFPLLLELESRLKQGESDLSALQRGIIQMSEIFQS